MHQLEKPDILVIYSKLSGLNNNKSWLSHTVDQNMETAQVNVSGFKSFIRFQSGCQLGLYSSNGLIEVKGSASKMPYSLGG